MTITCPQPVTVASLRGDPTIVVYGQATGSSGAPPVTVSCAPPSPGSFSPGVSTVTCLATDAQQRSASCTFTVTVTSPPRITLTRFVAFGDSMTAGEIPSEGLNPFTGRYVVNMAEAYPRRLEVALLNRYSAQTPSVFNAGVGGESAADGSRRLGRVLGGAGYEVLTLMDGANELLNGSPTAVSAAVSAMQTMVRDAKSRGLRVYLATLPPQNPAGSRGGGASLVPGYNNQLRSIAAAENVTLVDVFQAFGTNFSGLIDFDGLHPTPAGYQRIADTFFTAIRQNLEQPPALTLNPLTGRFAPRGR